MHSLQPQQNAQLRPRGHDENILEEAYRGRYARQRLLNFWPESSCGYHAIKRFVCIIQVQWSRRFDITAVTPPRYSIPLARISANGTHSEYGRSYSIDPINVGKLLPNTSSRR